MGRGFGAAIAKTVAIEIAAINLMKRMIWNLGNVKNTKILGSNGFVGLNVSTSAIKYEG